MSQAKPDDLQHLARAVLIMLVPFEGQVALPVETMKRIACREYWDALGGVDRLCENLRRSFTAKYAGIGYRFPRELDALLAELGRLPSRNVIAGEQQIDDVCAHMKTQSSLVSETLRRLGESRYNQDDANS